jgi:hypothetical protein
LQPPEQCRPRCDLDNAIEAEPDQGYAPGNETGDDGDQPFEAVVGDGEIFKPAATPDEFRAIIRLARMIRPSYLPDLLNDLPILSSQGPAGAGPPFLATRLLPAYS